MLDMLSESHVPFEWSLRLGDRRSGYTFHPCHLVTPTIRQSQRDLHQLSGCACLLRGPNRNSIWHARSKNLHVSSSESVENVNNSSSVTDPLGYGARSSYKHLLFLCTEVRWDDDDIGACFLAQQMAHLECSDNCMIRSPLSCSRSGLAANASSPCAMHAATIGGSIGLLRRPRHCFTLEGE
jgi:hypothetical protein